MDKFTKELNNITEYVENNFIKSVQDCRKVYENYKSNGFVGHIPYFLDGEYVCENDYQKFFKMFDESVKFLEKNQIKKAEEYLNKFFNYNIIFTCQKLDISNASYTRNGFIISNNKFSQKLFIKSYRKDYKSNDFYYRNGPLIEPWVGLFVNNHLKNSPYFCKVYFANVNKMYLVSEYVESCMDYTEEFNKCGLKDIKDKEEREKIVVDFFEKLIGKRINHFELLTSIEGGKFRWLDYKAENFIVYLDENGEKSIKMIDYGFCVSFEKGFISFGEKADKKNKQYKLIDQKTFNQLLK